MSKILITGGAGFIGSNSAKYFLEKGDEVIVLDNFSRNGTRSNIAWLENMGGKLEVVDADIVSDKVVLDNYSNNVDRILHLAAQVAVTLSVDDPRTDFEINALGTFNVLESIRKSDRKPTLIFSSTNKVYGGMEDVVVEEEETRYVYKDLKKGVSEDFSLDFHSPYGCSKGAADQYVRDYHRIYGLDTVVFRQSCIYGPRQLGLEDQGWVAWFIIALVTGKEITIYGDGKQVRDLLYVDDLVKAYDLAFQNISKCSGKIFNIGGGMENTMSVWKEFKPLLEKSLDMKIFAKKSDWRPGDQKIYVSDISEIRQVLGWKPEVSLEEGIIELYKWVKDNKNIFI